MKPRKEGKINLAEEGGVLSLQFCNRSLQSAMRIEDPYELALDYTRVMIGFLLFIDDPGEILIVGLGGGSLSKYCYRNFPKARTTTLEINPEVIALRKEFLVPEDSDRFRVVQADAADYLETTYLQADLILLDGFDSTGLPESLSSKSFYFNCRRALRPEGVLVANLFSSKVPSRIYLNRLGELFNRRVWVSRALNDPNLIAFAKKSDDFTPDWQSLEAKAALLEAQYHINLSFVVRNIRLRASREPGRSIREETVRQSALREVPLP